MNAASAHRQEFCVRWNSHLGSIGAAFPQLLAGQRFVDVTLACEGHQVHCHRLVLAACSSYFESILSENPCKHPVIILPSEIKLWEIQALVDFMYKGEVNVTQAGLPQLLRCAEQLRIRGLYGSDAALNLNQLKALSQKVTTNHSNAALSDGGNVVGLPNQAADSVDEDDTATSSTITSQINHLQQQQQQQQQLPLTVGNTPTIVPEQFIKKEPISSSSQQSTAANMTSSGINHKITQQQLQQQQQQQQQQSRQILNSVGLAAMIAATTTTTSASNAPSADDDDDSGDDSNSNAYENYETTPQINANKSQLSHHSQQKLKQELQQQHAMDANIDEDHNYVAHEEDDSFGGLGGLSINEHDSSIVQSSMEGPNGSKRVRRSEASLAQAAKLVSKGQTFQTVSNIFNIPVSTIRFYMARKGILPKRKRGRGASSNLGVGMNITAGSAVTAANVATVMTHALAQIKGTANSDNAVAAVAAALPHPDMPFNNMNYKLEQGAAHMI